MNRPLRGAVRVVPDKSITHRSVLLAALARGRSVVWDPNPGADCAAMLRAIEALGVLVRRQPDSWVIESEGLREPEEVLDLGNSGTALRLLTGALSAHPFFAVLTGDRSLRSRPMDRAIRPLEAMGARIEARAGGRAPLAIRGPVARGVDFENVSASAQVKSALLLAGLGLREGAVRVREPRPSRDHTERMLAYLGAPIQVTPAGSGGADPGKGPGPYTVRLEAGARLAPCEWRVPGDISAALFPLVAAAITPGSGITVEGVGLNPTRIGALSVLQRMGARLGIRPDPETGPEPTGSVTMEYGPLRAVDVGGEEAPRLIDEVPVLAVAAACAPGVSRFLDLAELRVKESDRVSSTCALLRALGVEVGEEANGFWIRGGRGLRGGQVETFADHRIAMAALTAGCAAQGEVSVDSLSMVATSDPGFVARLARLRGEGP